MSILIHTHDGGRFALEPKDGDTLARTVFLSRLWHGVPLCSGLAKCGLCRVRYMADAPGAGADELRTLGQEAVDAGWRLSCLHPSEPCEIEIPEPVRSGRTIVGQSAVTGDFVLAVDLGTTSIHWSVLADGQRVAVGHELNPQTGMGNDVMSRLAAAANAEGRFVLRALISDRLSEIADIAQRNMGGRCTGLTVSGNPAMIYILLGKKTDDLAAAPYELSFTGDEERKLGGGLPPAYIPPLLAPFVGADLSAGLTAAEYGETPEYPFMLVDLGTNGEFILALSPDKRLCASVPMGPALEGMGLSSGRTAGPGTITDFTVTPDGLSAAFFDEAPGDVVGLTGTAYLSLIANLRKQGVLDEAGHFAQGDTPLATKLAAALIDNHGEPALSLGEGLTLTASDVEEVLKVKAAFNLAFSALLDAGGLAPGDLARIHLAGALGEHIGLDDLETLGFLPPGAKGKTVKAGNTSLAGTELLVADPAARDFVRGLSGTVTALDLTDDPAFGDKFIERMRFAHVD